MKSIGKFLKRNRNIVLSYFAMIILLIVVSIIRPGFGLGSVNGLRSILFEAALVGLVSIGQTFVILTGGIDLSLPWIITGSAVILTILTQGQNAPALWAIPLVLVLCLLVGFINGIGIDKFEIPPPIMTLGMNAVLLGAITGISSGNAAIQGSYGKPPLFIRELSRGAIGNIPNLFLILIVLGILVSIVLSYSIFGRRLYALGTNKTVSLFSGVNVSRINVMVYMLSGFFGGIAGILMAGKVGQAYLGMGDPYLFTSVAAVVIGGANILGGSGHIIGTIGGALTLAVLTATIPVLDLPLAFQYVIYGLVVLIMVYISTAHKKREY